MPDVTPRPKLAPMPKRRPPGRARPDVALAERCEAHLARCTGRATVRHHRRRRSQGGDDSPENTADLCESCHLFVHTNVAWAVKTGWLIPIGVLPHKNPRSV